MTERITFNEKTPDVAWQKQLRDHYASELSPNVPLVLKQSVVKRGLIIISLSKQKTQNQPDLLTSAGARIYACV